MHFDEKGYNLLRAVIVLSWVGLAIVVVAGLLLYNEYVTLSDVAGVRWFGVVVLGFSLAMLVFMLVLQTVVRPRYVQQRAVRDLIGKLLKLLASEVETTKTFPGLDGAVIVATKTEGDYLYDIEVRPTKGPASNWEITRYRINSKDNLRDPLSIREKDYVHEVYEAMRAPTRLRDQQIKRAATLETRRQEAVIDTSDQSHVSSTHS